LTGHDLDVWFGPRVFRREMARYFLDYDGNKEGYGDLWDSTFIPVMDAITDGKKVKGVNLDFTYPPEQTAFEENHIDFYRKRLHQLNNINNSFWDRWEKHLHS